MRRESLLSGLVLSVLLCSSLVVSVEAASMWIRTYGGIAADWAYSVVETSDGGFAIAGATHSFSTGPFPYLLPDFWLVKTDALGNLQWNKTYGGPDSDEAYSLITTPDGGYAMAGYSTPWQEHEQAYLVKTDASGNLQWNQTYAGGGVSSLTATSDGGYALAGYTTLDIGRDAFWLIKTDELGVVPEYSSWLVPALVLTATAFIILNKKKLLYKRSPLLC